MSRSGASANSRVICEPSTYVRFGGGDAEVAREVLQAESGQVTRAGVVELGEDPRVDDVAAGDLVAAVPDRALGDLQSGDAAAQALAAAPPGQGDPVQAGPRLEIFQIEPEDVVPLDHVRVALADEARALLEQRPLVEPVAAHDVAEAGRVGERDGDDPIARAARRSGTRGPRSSSPRCRARAGADRRRRARRTRCARTAGGTDGPRRRGRDRALPGTFEGWPD